MKWVKERDHLIAQTMAFVQSVTGKKPEADVQAESAHSAAVFEQFEASVEAAEMSSQPPVARSPLREEIEGRVAAFRAHQRRFDRERDSHFNSVLMGIRAAITDPSKGSPP
jgi:hypothetical protein